MSGAEVSAHEVLRGVLLKYVSEARSAHERVRLSGRARVSEEEREAAKEAVHDFRVALRRLRTMLKPSRRVYGRRVLREIGMVLKHYADLMGELRDEEVLHETLEGIWPSLEPRVKSSLSAWMTRRGQRERALRRRAILALRQRERGGGAGGRAGLAQAIAAPSLLGTLDRLEKKLDRPRKAGSQDAGELGRRALLEAQADIDALGVVDPHNPAAMHEKRILYKRLRYTAELFQQALGEEAEQLAKYAAKHQTRLGKLHDLDEAIVCLSRTRSFNARTKTAILKALRQARAEALLKCLEDVAAANA